MSLNSSYLGSGEPSGSILESSPRLSAPDGAFQVPSVSRGSYTGLSAKKNACMICRRRKLKCDGTTPACGTCARLGHDCVYAESRKKSGPRRGYVKGLENRLAQVEGLLKQKEEAEGETIADPAVLPHNQEDAFEGLDIEQPHFLGDVGLGDVSENLQSVDFAGTFNGPFLASNFSPTDTFCWDMLEIGVEEPLPPQDVIDELTEVYFNKIQPSLPLIHQYRFLASMNLSQRARPPISLRYAMWMLAASTSRKYDAIHPHFYARAKKYADAAETAGRQKYVSIRHAQTFALIAKYEFKMMIFPNAYLSTGRASRLAQMMGLHRLDGLGMDTMQSMPSAVDWIEKEERRRTFWLIFSMDRLGSSGNGWPMNIDERDILTNLPSSEEAFLHGDEVPGISLSQALNPYYASQLSALSGAILVTSFYGRILEHIQRPSADNDDSNLNGALWKNHRRLDTLLLNTSLYLPSHLRMAAGSSDPNVILLNMALHAAVICLHQAAVSKIEKLELPSSLITDSRYRCFAAASEITSIMKRIAHMDLALLHNFIPFTLYVSTRIFADLCKSDPFNDEASSSVRFLLSALVAIKETNPLSESYLVQLNLEGTGLGSLQENSVVLDEIGRNVARMSLNDKSDDAEWVKFVSPLVRIVEQTEQSISVCSKSLRNSRENTTSGTSCEADAATGSLGQPSPVPIQIFDDLNSSLTTDLWELQDTLIPLNDFDSMLDFGAAV